jgi:hypothetical protein
VSVSAASVVRDSRRRLKGDPLVALDFLATLGPRPLAVYEAGPTGFALARAALTSLAEAPATCAMQAATVERSVWSAVGDGLIG